MDSALESWLPKIADWSDEDQQARVGAIAEIEAVRTGRYLMSPEEEADVAEGLAEADRGECVGDQRIAALWRRFGA